MNGRERGRAPEWDLVSANPLWLRLLVLLLARIILFLAERWREGERERDEEASVLESSEGRVCRLLRKEAAPSAAIPGSAGSPSVVVPPMCWL